MQELNGGGDLEELGRNGMEHLWELNKVQTRETNQKGQRGNRRELLFKVEEYAT